MEKSFDDGHHLLLNKGSLRFYVAGPMRGKEDNNFPAFDRCKAYLKSLGHEVISPACLDRSLDINWEGEGDHKSLYLAYARDTAALQVVDAVIVLADYEYSKGVAFEVASANFLGIPVFLFEPYGCSAPAKCMYPGVIRVKLATSVMGEPVSIAEGEIPPFAEVFEKKWGDQFDMDAQEFAKNWKEIVEKGQNPPPPTSWDELIG